MPTLFRDFETRGTLNLPKVGAWCYAAHPSTDVWCCAYAVDDGEVKLWVPGDPDPPEFVEAAQNPEYLVSAFNDSFERAIEHHIMGPRYSFPIVPLERHGCSQAIALAHALPASLELTTSVLKLDHQKDKAGARIMLKWSKPRKPRAGEDPKQIYWHDDPKERELLFAYCRQDVRAEREVSQRLPPLSADEQAVWLIDAVINDRGFHTDGTLIEAASRTGSLFQEKINVELRAVSNGAIDSIGQVAQILDWLHAHGCTNKTVEKARRANDAEAGNCDREPRPPLTLLRYR
jgi:DNA polymerase